jgi:hypothetical protein
VLEFTGLSVYDKKPAWLDSAEYPGIWASRKNIGILAEFGRLVCKYGNGAEVAAEWAVELVRMNPRLSSKEAVAWLRQRRLQKSNLGNAEDLLGVITKAIDGYLANHPGTLSRAIVQALDGARWIFDDEDETHAEG